MEGKYRIIIMDVNTGERINRRGLPGQIDTDLALICAQGGHSELGDAFFCALISDGETPHTASELSSLTQATFHLFEQMGNAMGDPMDQAAIVSCAFMRYLRKALPPSTIPTFLAAMAELCASKEADQ